MRTVMDGQSVCHVWAQQNQSEARNSNGQLYFEGPTLYSYGRHFRIGHFATNKAGRRAILLNSNSYSITTSKHQNWARQATHGLGLSVFNVPGAQEDHAANVKHLAKAAAEHLIKSRNPRSTTNRNHYAAQALRSFEAAKEYAAFFGVKFKAPDLESVATELEAQAKRDAAAKRLAEAVRRKDIRGATPDTVSAASGTTARPPIRWTRPAAPISA